MTAGFEQVPITEAMRTVAKKISSRETLRSADMRRLQAIMSGKQKKVDAEWWRGIAGSETSARADQLAAMADPARNPNQHEREVAAAMLRKERAKGIGLEEYDRLWPPLQKALKREDEALRAEIQNLVAPTLKSEVEIALLRHNEAVCRAVNAAIKAWRQQ
jgi:hypothetical protein